MSNHHSDDSVFKIALNLTGACLISGIIIAGVYALTAKTAVRKAEEMKTAAMKELVLEADDFAPLPDVKGGFEAKKDGRILAYIVPTEGKGYGGSIKILVAVTPEGRVLNFAIIESRETPGLGDKAGQKPFTSEIIGKTAEHLVVTKNPQQRSEVLAISGATITSRAVTAAVKEAIEKVGKYLKGNHHV